LIEKSNRVAWTLFLNADVLMRFLMVSFRDAHDAFYECDPNCDKTRDLQIEKKKSLFDFRNTLISNSFKKEAAYLITFLQNF
jgi:hypothetical protein